MFDAEHRETLLEVNNIEVIYNHVILVLKGVSLSVPKGGITALLGGNGAGKTTTLEAISNLLASERGEVTKGSITYKGEKVARQDPALPAGGIGDAVPAPADAQPAGATSSRRRSRPCPGPAPAAGGDSRRGRAAPVP